MSDTADDIRLHIHRLRQERSEFDYWHEWGLKSPEHASTSTRLFGHLPNSTWGDISKMTREELIEWLETNLAVMNVLDAVR